MAITRQMEDVDAENFFYALTSSDWPLNLRYSANINDTVRSWTYVYAFIIEKSAPLRECRVSDRWCPWLISDLKQLNKIKKVEN